MKFQNFKYMSPKQVREVGIEKITLPGARLLSKIVVKDCCQDVAKDNLLIGKERVARRKL